MWLSSTASFVRGLAVASLWGERMGLGALYLPGLAWLTGEGADQMAGTWVPGRGVPAHPSPYTCISCHPVA